MATQDRFHPHFLLCSSPAWQPTAYLVEGLPVGFLTQDVKTGKKIATLL